MKYPCDVVRDLLPLYQDGVCSAESRKLVEAHLAECESCRDLCRALAEPHAAPAEESTREAGAFRRFRKKMGQKQLLAAGCAALAVLLMGCGGIWGMEAKTVQIPYEGGNIEVRAEGGDLVARLAAVPYTRVSSKRVDDALYFCFFTTLRQKTFGSSPNSYSEYVLAYDRISAGQKSGADSLEQVYYYTGDYAGLEELSGGELAQRTADAVLLWEAE